MKKNVLTLVLIILPVSFILAWGGKGHVLIAQIAKAQLNKTVIKNVDAYLNGMSWEDLSCWMDDVKGDEELEYLKEWHYVNVAKDKTYVIAKKPDLINRLEYYLAILSNKNKYQKNEIEFALKIVFHLIGDIAQPLHCGYAQDKGGTQTHIKFQNHLTNLHKVWDSEIIEKAKINNYTCNKILLTLSAEQITAYKKMEIAYWFADSRALLYNVYNFKNNQVDEKYLNDNGQVVAKQLVKAGIRLATVLNQYFKN